MPVLVDFTADDSATITQSDTVDIMGLAGDATLIADAPFVTVVSLNGVQGPSSLNFVSQNSTGTANNYLSVDARILDVENLDSVTFNVGENSITTLDASNVDTLDSAKTYSLHFTGDGSGTFILDKPEASLGNGYTFNVTGMQEGDVITLEGGAGGESLDLTAGGYDAANQMLTLTQGGEANAPVAFNISMTQDQYDTFAENPELYLSGGNFIAPLCFAQGTLIATPTGQTRVENLKIGDLVTTAEGKVVSIKWIGRQSTRAHASARHRPVRICQGALGRDIPSQDLIVTACHGMIIDGLIIQANALVNDASIVYVPRIALPPVITYYHIETANHDVILANGAAAETFVDNATRQTFDNYAEYQTLFGAEQRILELEMPRAKSCRQVPRRIREALARRARQLGLAPERQAA